MHRVCHTLQVRPAAWGVAVAAMAAANFSHKTCQSESLDLLHVLGFSLLHKRMDLHYGLAFVRRPILFSQLVTSYCWCQQYIFRRLVRLHFFTRQVLGCS